MGKAKLEEYRRAKAQRAQMRNAPRSDLRRCALCDLPMVGVTGEKHAACITRHRLGRFQEALRQPPRVRTKRKPKVASQ